ncbi:Lrp/AsnC family transcriptional regulator [Thalassococcus sp. S3]|uniref:Lrp/AsnC family transcriptional regulator n=1 Tax=Thalassococcus sp. S3 TaxID=2017482 RepID=UPI0010248122|nr:Lrp/AsnC family transcriptional regulator [Thalassococcus sp. S3]QBF31550.1 AsnC family transcriptional regulator [Thalassococcus sp. S3]
MPYIHLDAIDLKILDALQKDGRLSNSDLSDIVGLSQSPCLRRVKRLEKEGFITSYRAILDREAVGLSLTVFAAFRLKSATPEAAEEFEQRLTALPQVITCHMLSGDSDCLAEIVAPSVAAYQAFLTEHLRALPHVRDIRSNIALKRVKSETPMPLAHIKRPLDGPDC